MSISQVIVGDGITVNKTQSGILVCLDSELSKNTLASAVTVFFTQLFVVNFIYRILFYFSRSFHLSRLVPQMLTGLILSRDGMGETKFSQKYIFPYKSFMVLETIANLALVYYMFLVGLELDLKLIQRSGTKSQSIAFAGVLVPLFVGWSLFWWVGATNVIGINPHAGALFYAIALASTNFSDLARILADLKLLRSDIGKTAMSAAIITDLITLILLVIAISASTKQGHYYAMLSTFAFVLFCVFALRPILNSVFDKVTVGGTNVSETHIWFVLAAVSLAGLITDSLGARSVVGGFMLGFIMPNDHNFRAVLVEKVENFVSGFMMPLFYAVSGLRTDIHFMIDISDNKSVFPFILVIAFFAKILTTYVVSILYGLPSRDGLAIGMLMNTKGIMTLIIVNFGRSMQTLDNETFPLMVILIFVISSMVQPILALTYNQKRMFFYYKNRTIQKIKNKSEFRLLACVHNMQNSLAILGLIQISNPTEASPISITAINLVELTSRTAASMLIQNDEVKTRGAAVDRSNTPETDQIIDAFQDYEENNETVIAETVTIVSPFPTMHEDICTLAEDKRATCIILPFNKQLTADGRLGDGNPALESINRNLLAISPCSVGILVDRGMSAAYADKKHAGAKKRVITIFMGGRDDREALSYAWRMVGGRSINLTVVRFVPGEEALKEIKEQFISIDETTGGGGEESTVSSSVYEREKHLDDECIYEFTFKTMDDPSILYMEKVVNDGHETFSTIKNLTDRYDLYIVGRGKGINSPLTSSLSDWNSCAELGTIGETLSCSDFIMHASVLVVQQYSPLSRSRSGGHNISMKSKRNDNILDPSDDEEEDN